MQKREPVIIAPDYTNDELYEWMHQKINAAQDLKWANEVRAKQAENLSSLEQDITNLEKETLIRLKVVLKLVSLSVTLYLLKMPLTRENTNGSY
nr:hypothetical protein [Escherichia coli]